MRMHSVLFVRDAIFPHGIAKRASKLFESHAERSCQEQRTAPWRNKVGNAINLVGLVIHEKSWIACTQQKLCTVSKFKKKIVKETWIDITIYV